MKLPSLLAVFTEDRAVQALQRWAIDLRTQLAADRSSTKAWARVETDGAGGVRLVASHNVARVGLRSSPYRVELFFTESMPSVNLAVAGSVVRATAPDRHVVPCESGKDSCSVMVGDDAGAVVDVGTSALTINVFVFA